MHVRDICTPMPPIKNFFRGSEWKFCPVMPIFETVFFWCKYNSWPHDPIPPDPRTTFFRRFTVFGTGQSNESALLRHYSWIRGCERWTKMNRRKRSVTIYVRNKQRYNPASKLYNFINVRVENFAGTKIGDIKEVCMRLQKSLQVLHRKLNCLQTRSTCHFHVSGGQTTVGK